LQEQQQVRPAHRSRRIGGRGSKIVRTKDPEREKVEPMNAGGKCTGEEEQNSTAGTASLV